MGYLSSAAARPSPCAERGCERREPVVNCAGAAGGDGRLPRRMASPVEQDTDLPAVQVVDQEHLVDRARGLGQEPCIAPVGARLVLRLRMLACSSNKVSTSAPLVRETASMVSPSSNIRSALVVTVKHRLETRFPI